MPADTGDLEREERTARLLRRPVRDPLVPPFDQVEARLARRDSGALVTVALVAVVVLAFVLGGALAQRRAVLGQPSAVPSAAPTSIPSTAPTPAGSASHGAAGRR